MSQTAYRRVEIASGAENDPATQAAPERRRARRAAAARHRARIRRRRMTALGLIAAVIAAGAIAIAGGGDERAPDVSAAAAAAARLDAPRLAGQRLIAGWSGTRPPKGVEKLIRKGAVAGVIVFADNVSSRKQIRATIRDLEALRRPAGLRDPLLVMVDQEGGQVKRLGGPPDSSAEAMGSRGAGYARKQGRATARSLLGVGINTNLAPVLDVAVTGGAIDREDRAFGHGPAKVERVGVGGFARGLRRGGAVATAKHFPGIGRITTNTDFAAQKIATSKRKLRRRDEPPFAAFGEAGGEMIMLSLATYTAFSDRPAAFSRKIATGELRRRVGFEGVSITDGLGAAAAQKFGSRAEVALAAAGAGADLLLYTDHTQARDAARLLTRRLRAGKLDRGDFERSVARVLELRSGL